MSKQPKAAPTRVQHVPGVDDSFIVDRFIGGESVIQLARDFSVDGRTIELAIRAWAEPYGHLDFAAQRLFDRWLPMPSTPEPEPPPAPLVRYRDYFRSRPLQPNDVVVCIDETGAPDLVHGAAYEVLSIEQEGTVRVRRVGEAGQPLQPILGVEASRMRWSGT